MYSITPNAQSNSHPLSTDVIILIIGTVVNEYNAVIHRTLFIDPTLTQKALYTIVNDL